MAWLTQPEASQAELAARFRQLLRQEGFLVLPGVFDGLSALLARRAGFSALYLSGAAYTASRGLPDLGLVTVTELAERVRDVVRAAQLPLIVDIDTGFGGVLHAARAARELAEARAAGVQIEDQELPKKCGHLSGKSLVTPREMAQKVYALKSAAPELFVVARTDAYEREGLEGVIARARLYVEAGADAVFPEALTSAEEFRAVREALPDVPLVANLTEFGKTPYFTAEEVRSWGYQLALFPVSALRVAARAMEHLYRHLRAAGTARDLLQAMQTRAELYETLAYAGYEELDARIARAIPSGETAGTEAAPSRP